MPGCSIGGFGESYVIYQPTIIAIEQGTRRTKKAANGRYRRQRDHHASGVAAANMGGILLAALDGLTAFSRKAA